MTILNSLMPRLRTGLLVALGSLLAAPLAQAQTELSEESLAVLASMAPGAP
ncbi:MAG: hypothetical protein GX789_00760, partial [Pseudomonas formosensis]|nr:hypothetical protein [Halopseudomonas formosensis]